MSRMNGGTHKRHGSQWNGTERRAEPRVLKRNMGRAKLLIMLIALGITVGSWLGFATMRPYQGEPSPAPIQVGFPAAPSYPLLDRSESSAETGK